MRTSRLVLAAIAALGVAGSTQATDRGAIHSVTSAAIIHSNDVLSEIEPCGCRTNPLGGLGRKANLLKTLGPGLIQVDAGDLLFASDTLPASLEKQSELQASSLLKILDQTGLNAVVPGEKDFALGVKTFDRLRKSSKARFFAANLKRRNGSPFLEPSTVITQQGQDGKKWKVAIIGLVGPSLKWPKELKASSAIEAARAQVKALRSKADFVVALTHQGYDADRELAEKVSGIDMIIGGHTQTFLQTPVQVGKTWIFQSSFRNQYVGIIPLEKPWDVKDYQMAGLDSSYDSPIEKPGPVDEAIRDFKARLAELNAKESQADEANLASADGAKFHTFPKCAECHLKQFDFWRKTPHARAFQVLFEKQQHKNKECLGCHTVGASDPNGWADVNHLAQLKSGEALADADIAQLMKALHEGKDLKAKAKLKAADAEGQILPRAVAGLSQAWTPVQCENCHQPGRNHPFSSGYTKAVDKNACLKCHTAERAPSWYTASGQPDWPKIDAKRASITCPAGEISPDELE